MINVFLFVWKHREKYLTNIKGNSGSFEISLWTHFIPGWRGVYKRKYWKRRTWLRFSRRFENLYAARTSTTRMKQLLQESFAAYFIAATALQLWNLVPILTGRLKIRIKKLFPSHVKTFLYLKLFPHTRHEWQFWSERRKNNESCDAT